MAKTGGVVLILILLIAFACELFNVTFERHYQEIRRWFHLPEKDEHAPPPARRRQVVVFGAFMLAGGCIFAAIDPTFGISMSSLLSATALACTLLLLTLVYFAPVAVHMRRTHRERGVLQVIPGSLVIGVACVFASRLLHFQPGYAFGILASIGYKRELDEKTEGRLAATSALCVLAVSLVAWFAWAPLSRAAGQGTPNALLLLADTTLANLFLFGLETACFSMIPLKFMEGSLVTAWSKSIWACVFAFNLFVYIHVLLRPSSGYVSGGAPSMTTVLVATVGMLAVSVGLWAYFKVRPEPGGDDRGEGGGNDRVDSLALVGADA